MIATNIDGSAPGNNPLTDLLKVVANPAAYTDKIAELEAATARYEKMVALAGPASEIVALREQAGKDREAAKEALATAKGKANAMIKDAETKAAGITKAAEIDAKTRAVEAADKLSAAKALEAEAQAKLADIQAAEADVAKRAEEAAKTAETLKAEIAKAKKEKDEAAALKADLLAKAKAFVGSL